MNFWVKKGANATGGSNAYCQGAGYSYTLRMNPISIGWRHIKVEYGIIVIIDGKKA
jgi:hypothetical protein